MKWNIVCRIGDGDTFLPQMEETIDKYLVLHFSGGTATEKVRESVIAQIEKQYKATVPGIIQDIVYASMVAYLADVCIPRRTAADRWSRELVLHLPVFEQSQWQKVQTSFEALLGFLTGDNWMIKVRARSGEIPKKLSLVHQDLPKTVCLLSGGLDSLVGAVNLLSGGNAVSFVSHTGGGLTPKFQNDIFGALYAIHGDLSTENQFIVMSPHLGSDFEKTTRSRSILFIALGIAVANILGDLVPVVVPENGFISLNIPLTKARVGTSSTRTTHPYFIAGMRQLLSELGISNSIEVPYRHMTKGEMLMHVTDREVLKSLLALSMSCSHPEVERWQGSTPGKHCGYCLPCLVRRAAVAAANLEDADASYTFDVHNDSLSGSRISDLRAIKIALARDTNNNTSNLLHIMAAGPLPPDEITKYADVYKRGMSELSTFLNTSK